MSSGTFSLLSNPSGQVNKGSLYLLAGAMANVCAGNKGTKEWASMMPGRDRDEEHSITQFLWTAKPVYQPETVLTTSTCLHELTGNGTVTGRTPPAP